MKRIRIILLLLLTCGLFFHAEGQKKITYDDLFKNRTFSQKPLPGLQPMNDGNHYSVMEEGLRIVKYSYQSGEKVAVVFDLKKAVDAPLDRFSGYEFSADETKILLTTGVVPIYRHSFTAEYFIWNSVTEDLLPLSEKGKQQLATFSPDGERVASA